LIFGLAALGIACALLCYQVVEQMLVPGVSRKLALLPLIVVVFLAGGVALLLSHRRNARGLGAGIVLWCSASLAAAVGAAVHTVTDFGVIGSDSPQWASISLSVEWLKLFMGFCGIAGLALFATWAVQTRAASSMPTLVVVAAGCYALAQLVGFITGLFPADLPPQFEPTSAERLVSNLGAGAVCATFIAAIVAAALTRSAWCVLGLGAAWATALLINVTAVATVYGSDSVAAQRNIYNALWFAGLAVAIVAVTRDRKPQSAEASSAPAN
jgi:hypothetical protein